MTKHAELIAAVRGRKGSPSRFGYGIGTADRIVAKALGEISDGFCRRLAGVAGAFDRDAAIKEAMGRLVCCTPDAKVEQTATCSSFKILLPDGIEAPPHTLMVLRYTLTTARKDRDGDVLHPDGADIDPSGPMLWQHLANLPIGKMLSVVEKSPRRLREIGVLLDLNELTEDCAKLFEAGALRFSHGFQAIDWREMKAEPVRPGKAHSPGKIGFEVLRFEILERSAVSVPANSEAILELGSRGKGFKSEPMKAQVKSLMAGRPVQVHVAEVESPKEDKCGPCGVPYMPAQAVTTGKPLTPAQQMCLSSLMETAAKCRECASACAPLSDRMWNVIQACGTVAGACDVASNMLAAGSVAGLSAAELVLGESLTVMSIHHIPVCEECLATCQKCAAAIKACSAVEVVPSMAAAGEIETKAKEKQETMLCPECDAEIPLGSDVCPECEAEIGEEEEPEDKSAEPDGTKGAKWPDPDTIMVCPNAECGYRAPKRFWTPEKVKANGGKFTCPKCKADMQPEDGGEEEPEEEVPAEKHLEGTHDQMAHGHSDGGSGASASARQRGEQTGWGDVESEHTVRQSDHPLSREAAEKTDAAWKEGTATAHGEAAHAHEEAAKLHEGDPKRRELASAHSHMAEVHRERQSELKKKPKSGIWVTLEQMRTVCPESADAMQVKGLATINIETLEPDVLRKFLQAKAGRVLSGANVASLQECLDDLEELAGMQMPRAAAALAGRIVQRLSTLVEAATPAKEVPDGEKHLEGQHDQATHAHGGGASGETHSADSGDGKVPLTSTQIGRVLSKAEVGDTCRLRYTDDPKEYVGVVTNRSAWGEHGSKKVDAINVELNGIGSETISAKTANVSKLEIVKSQKAKEIGKLLARATPAELARFQKSVQAILRVQELDAKGEEYRKLCSC